MVAIKQGFPKSQRSIDDDLAVRALLYSMRVLTSMMRLDIARDWIVREAERSFPGIWGSVLCCKCYINEKVVASAGQTDAVVSLGAGAGIYTDTILPFLEI